MKIGVKKKALIMTRRENEQKNNMLESWIMVDLYENLKNIKAAYIICRGRM